MIEAASSFDPTLKQAVATAIDVLAPEDDRTRVLEFLLAQTDRVLQQQADADAARAERQAYRQFRRRWGPADDPLHSIVDPGKRVLVIDERLPAVGRDAGSQAILSHIRAFQRLDYRVSLVASEQMTHNGGALAAMGVDVCGRPFYGSVEDVLRRQAGCFDIVYLHRSTTAARYLALVRRCCPRARLLYSVADLHFVRLQRESAVEERPELMAASHHSRLAECMAAWQADAVISHSLDEVELLRRTVPGARVYRVPWDIPTRNTMAAWDSRHGSAFIGGYGHTPNIDAACFLAEAVMPLFWQTNQAIECYLVGSAMPDAVKRLACPGIVIMGQVEDLQSAVLDHVRLTVAPLRFGGGVKGGPGKLCRWFALCHDPDWGRRTGIATNAAGVGE